MSRHVEVCVHFLLQGAVGTNITITTLCDIMCNGSIADVLQRYAVVNSLILATYEQKCLDVSYKKMISDLQKMDWNSSASVGGRWNSQEIRDFLCLMRSIKIAPSIFFKIVLFC